MDPDQIQAFMDEADQYAADEMQRNPDFSLAVYRKVRDTHFTSLVRAAAFEEAAEVCIERAEQYNEHKFYKSAGVANSLANNILALATAEKEPR